MNILPTPTTLTSQKDPIAWEFSVVFATMLLGNNLFTKITLLFCLLYFGYKSYRVLPDIFASIKQALALVMLEIWAAISIFWSVVPSVTQDIVMTQSAFFCLSILMARNAVGKDLARSLKLTALFVITVVVLYALAFPAAAISSFGFKAFYGNKNGLGMVVAICILAILYSTRVTWIDYGFSIIAFALLILSQSKTSLMVVLLVIVSSLLIFGFNKLYCQMSEFPRGMFALFGRGVPTFFYAMIAAGIFFRDLLTGYLINILPYDLLTGRGELWVTVLRRTERDLLWGLGPGSFWAAGRQSEIVQTSLLARYPGWIDKLGSADGGYVDLVGSLGFIALALLLCSFVSTYRRLVSISGNQNIGLFLVLITFFIFHNVTETTVYNSTNSLWFLYLFLSFYLVFLQAQNRGEYLKTDSSTTVSRHHQTLEKK